MENLINNNNKKYIKDISSTHNSKMEDEQNKELLTRGTSELLF